MIHCACSNRTTTALVLEYVNLRIWSICLPVCQRKSINFVESAVFVLDRSRGKPNEENEWCWMPDLVSLENDKNSHKILLNDVLGFESYCI